MKRFLFSPALVLGLVLMALPLVSCGLNRGKAKDLVIERMGYPIPLSFSIFIGDSLKVTNESMPSSYSEMGLITPSKYLIGGTRDQQSMRNLAVYRELESQGYLSIEDRGRWQKPDLFGRDRGYEFCRFWDIHPTDKARPFISDPHECRVSDIRSDDFDNVQTCVDIRIGNKTVDKITGMVKSGNSARIEYTYTVADLTEIGRASPSILRYLDAIGEGSITVTKYDDGWR